MVTERILSVIRPISHRLLHGQNRVGRLEGGNDKINVRISNILPLFLSFLSAPDYQYKAVLLFISSGQIIDKALCFLIFHCSAVRAITNRRVVITIPDGSGAPDGMAIDAEDKLWIALWGSGTVGRFDPETGKLLQSIKVPAPNVSSCAFGGKNLETLYITTARAWVSPDQLEQFPLSGGLFVVKPGVRGVQANFCDGQ